MVCFKVIFVNLQCCLFLQHLEVPSVRDQPDLTQDQEVRLTDLFLFTHCGGAVCLGLAAEWVEQGCGSGNGA